MGGGEKKQSTAEKQKKVDGVLTPFISKKIGQSHYF